MAVRNGAYVGADPRNFNQRGTKALTLSRKRTPARYQLGRIAGGFWANAGAKSAGAAAVGNAAITRR
jgi:hypothetical protein